MKEYLKMEDAFSRKVDPITDWDEHGHEVKWITLLSHQAEHAAHAINSHDELVQMSHELLAALKQVVGDVRALADHSYGVHGLHQNGDLAPWNSLFSGGFFESWLLSVDDADAVIAKTEGGAA